MPKFGKDKNARNEELDRQAAEEVERLTRRGMGPGGMPGMPGMGGPPRIGPPSPLEMMAAEVADRPPPSRRRPEPARRPAARPQQAFTPMPSGEVGSSFGPGGLNPGPRGGFAAPPPPAFGGGAYDEDYGGGHVTGPPVYYAGEPDEEEEMSITEMALMDHAARTGHNPEDLVMMYDAGSAEEMRDAAMRQFYERQQARRPGATTNDPFAPAGQRRGPAGSAPVRRVDDPKAAGGALAQRLAARRRREEEEAGRAAGASGPAPAARARPTVPSAASASARPAPAEREVDDGALSRVLARRRAALGVDPPAPEPEAPGRRHAAARAQQAPTLRAVPEPDDDVPSLEDMAASAPAKRAPATRATKKAAAEPIAMPPAEDPPAAKAPAARRAATAAAADAPAKKAPAKRATKKAAAAEAAPAPAAKAMPKAKKAGATLAAAPAKTAAAAEAAPAPAAKATPKAKKAGATLAAAPAKTTAAPAKKAGRPAGKAKTIFCIECGEKNPIIAKFCFNCGTRLAAPEG